MGETTITLLKLGVVLLYYTIGGLVVMGLISHLKEVDKRDKK